MTNSANGIEEFKIEETAFNRLFPSLLEKYPGQYVAIFQEQVVANGIKKFDVLRSVQVKFGNVPCYIGLVGQNQSLRKFRVPSIWKS